jgi:hypothetical protein
MTDFTKLFQSPEWAPVVEAVARVLYKQSFIVDPDEIPPFPDEEAHHWKESARTALSAFLSAATEKGVIKEVYFGMNPALVFAIIKTGDK